jgi:hypothetical protein
MKLIGHTKTPDGEGRGFLLVETFGVRTVLYQREDDWGRERKKITLFRRWVDI